MLELHGVGQPHAYETYRRRILYSSILPIEIGDFVTKDESAERSLGLSGIYPPPRKEQNVPKDGTKIHIISIRAKKKREKCASKCNFLPKDYLESGIFKSMGMSQLDIKTISKLPFAEESGRGFPTGIYLFFR